MICVGLIDAHYFIVVCSVFRRQKKREQDTWTVKNGDAMVDGIQLGRVFTMFEKDEVYYTACVQLLWYHFLFFVSASDPLPPPASPLP